MITKELRQRLEIFICDHIDCEDEVCVLRAAQGWVKEMQIRGYPEHEMLLLGLAFQAYLAKDVVAKKKIGAYETAISTVVAQKALTNLAPVMKLVP
jgi:hypothetical protein